MRDVMVDELLALFPLHTVLFPGMPLPLHVFEERYKLMIGRCLEEERPFGVVLIQSGPEVGGPAVPHLVGTTAHIAAVKRADDGRMNLIAIGQERFRIVGVVRQEPYLVARVQPLADEEPDAAVAPLAAEVRAILAGYLRDLFVLLEQPEEELEIPTEPARLSLVAAAVMQIPLAERQTLLEMTDVSARLQQEKDWLAREAEKQRTLLRMRKRLGDVTLLDSSQVLERLSLN
jgi:Lon protease-like protein